mmetsp:Transcript_10998/g.15498  ORF Transcript_10998/g.15498 Transcript_10998/m.15498 type:complete len:219 (+) Transcript_10998:912-1568(+)
MPPLNSINRPSGERCPSGKAIRGMPFFSQLQPSLNVLSCDLRSSRSIKMWFPPSSCCPMHGTDFSSAFEMNLNTGSRTVQITGMSNHEAWLATYKQGPCPFLSSSISPEKVGYESVIANHTLDQTFPVPSYIARLGSISSKTLFNLFKTIITNDQTGPVIIDTISVQTPNGLTIFSLGPLFRVMSGLISSADKMKLFLKKSSSSLGATAELSVVVIGD